MAKPLRSHVRNGAAEEAGPRRRPASPLDETLLVKAFARVEAIAMGAALGLLLGLVIATATIILVAKGGDPLAPNLRLLGQYLPATPSAPLAH
jgi:hypothetical protein